jgi:ABC-type amino acid transport substrate-binding protein
MVIIIKSHEHYATLHHTTADDFVGAMPVAEPPQLVDRLRAIRQRGKLNCGFDASFVPGFASYGADGQIEGIEVDICVALAVSALGGSTRATLEERVAENRKLINPVLVRT